MGRFDYSSQPLRGKNTAATEMLTNVLQFLLVKYGGSEETTSAIHISLVRYLKGEGKESYIKSRSGGSNTPTTHLSS
jgi:hypothetical protein